MLVPKLRFRREDGTNFPEWKKTCVGNVFEKIKDKNRNCSNTNVITNSAEFGLISQRDFFDKDIAVEGKTDNYTIIKTNDFVYNPRKSSLAPFGAFNGYTLAESGIVSPLYFCLRMKNDEMSANFMLWYFKSSRWHRFIYENGEQGGARHDRVGVSEEMLTGIPIDKPCLEEQQKIADFLSTVDKVIAQSEAEVKNLEQQKKAAMQKIFSQEVRFKREDGTDYPEWEEKKLSDICDVRDGTHDSPKYVNSGFPLITSKNLTSYGTIDMTDINYICEDDFNSINCRSKVDIGNILVGMIGTIGKPVLVKEAGFAIKNVALLKPLFIDNAFLLYYLQSGIVEKIFRFEQTGNTQKFISLSTIRQLNVTAPCLEEQQKIADFLSAYDEAISYAKQELDKWKELKKGLLQQMFV